MRVRIMSGPSGAGKSHVVQSRKAAQDHVVSADDFFMRGGKYIYERELQGAAHLDCLSRYLDLLEEHADTPREGADQVTIWVDNTNIQAWEIAPYYQLAAMQHANVEIIEVWPPDLQTCVVRNVHDVPVAVVARQYHRMQARSLPSFWKVEAVISMGHQVKFAPAGRVA